MFKKIIGLSLAIMLGFGTVGCISIEVPNEQQQEENQPQIQDEDVTDEYLENKKSTTELEKAKESIESWLEENNLSDFKVAIDEQNNRVYIVGKSNSEDVASWINENEWYVFVEFGKKITTKYHQEFNVDVAFVIVTSDVEKCYLSVFNGEVMFNVEDELN